jgi:ABC-type spermidine/putrescine transport system permease subunit I
MQRWTGGNELKAIFRIYFTLAAKHLCGVLLVFIPALGAYLNPQLVGNQRSPSGQVITYKIKNIPATAQASAKSLTL